MFARPADKRVPTIKALAHASVVASVLISVIVLTGLLSTSSKLESATETTFSSAESFALASEAQLALLMYQRISNLYALNGDPQLDGTRAELLDQLRRVLDNAQDYVTSDGERLLLEDVSALLDGYLEERAQLEARQADIGELLRLTQPSLDRIVDALDALHDLNEEQVVEAQTAAMRSQRTAGAFSSIAAFVLVCGLLALAFGLHRAVLRPILDLHETITRFRSGAIDTRAGASGLQELRELEQAFNEMADALARQRESQLAFLAGVAHDLKNPLNALRIGIHALAQEQSRLERDRAHSALDGQVDRLARMIDDLLDATRIEAGKLEMRFEEIDLRSAVEDMVRLYAPTSSDHRISVMLPADPVLVKCDPLRVEQVVSNLLSNAIKYSPDGGAIQVSVEQTGDDVVLSVADEGVGIRPEDRSDIFLPFRPRQADAPAGAGLGLSVVRRIVEAHGGHIDIESGAPRGTVFRVILRRTSAPRDPRPRSLSA